MSNQNAVELRVNIGRRSPRQNSVKTSPAQREQERRLNQEMEQLAANLQLELQEQEKLNRGIQSRRAEQEAAASAGREAAAVARRNSQRQSPKPGVNAGLQFNVNGSYDNEHKTNHNADQAQQDAVPATVGVPVEGFPGWFFLMDGDNQPVYYNVESGERHDTHPSELDLEGTRRRSGRVKWSTSDAHRGTFFIVAAALELLILVLYVLLADYDDPAKPDLKAESDLHKMYPFFQDVHVMIFVGFGFLMTFLNRYSYSAVGYNFLLSAFTIQWCILVGGIMAGAFEEFPDNCPPLGYTLVRHDDISFNDTSRWCIKLNMGSLVAGDFGAGAVMITYGAVLGKTNPMQLMIVAALEIILYELNIQIGVTHFGAVDMGGSIFIHTFGAYFGLALSYVLTSSKLGPRGPFGKLATDARAKMKASTPTSDLFSMVGTLFLWMFWPSFNGVLAGGDQQYRVITNTVLALSACCVTAFAVDNLVRPNHKFNMVSIQNATLAGGVAVGASADLVILPYGAMLVGMVAGALSVVGYRYIQPALENGGLDDTCGVHNLHGMPGVMAGLAGALAAAFASPDEYGSSIGTVFPARAEDSGRTAGDQARNQISALFITLILSILGGVLTGIIVKFSCCLYSGQVKGGDEAVRHGLCNLCHSNDQRMWYDDSYYWNVPEESSSVSDSASSLSSASESETESDDGDDESDISEREIEI